ncbi:hypothetical protein LTR37_004052 [Vermiconidia calcicola]|uniref:Uncharacterized protein n=1 Tax=Vermiconidia calcicola TaxID=1690605 RepID=A0ACC3NN26_9PEZI|nr:hypothetical protein LTR37_004052 [Vermiconidia calcicola]
MTVNITFEEPEARFKTVLRVQEDPANFRSRLGCNARFFLIRGRPDAGEQVEEGTSAENEDHEEYVGDLQAWRIDKPTAAHPNPRTRWVDELLTVNPPDANARVSETAYCLQTIYPPTGALHTRATSLAAHRPGPAAFRDNSLLFIEMIHFFQGFRQRGLLKHALRAYFDFLANLPEWFAFHGTVLLVPAAPDGERGLAWGDDNSANNTNAERILMRAYENHGGFQTRFRKVPIDTGDEEKPYGDITLMGRIV